MNDQSPSDDEWEELQRAGDAAVRKTGRLLGRSISWATALARDTRKAFRQGLDTNVEDAVIVEESEDNESR